MGSAMRKIFSWFMVCVFVGLLALVLIPQPVSAMTGSGTVGDPYMVYNVTDLQNMSNNLSAYYELANDIDASDTVTWNGGQGFVPIGTAAVPFTGHFDGNFSKIDGLYINRNAVNQALFGSISGGEVANLIMTNVDVTAGGPGLGGYSRVAGLASHIVSGTISQCMVQGDIVGRNEMGLLVGFIANNPVTISECASSGTVYGTFRIGGLIGANGYPSTPTITDCYSRADVTAWSVMYTSAQNVGGFAGSLGAGSQIEDCYSTGFVSAGGWHVSATIGGFLGQAPGGCTNCFWDTQTSGRATSACGTGKTTIEMKTQSTFTDAGWDFDTIWTIGGTVNDGYPYLLWWYDPPDIISDVNQVVWFQPNAIIEGTELPNRAQGGTLIDGVIHWGANPAGITISHGELIPEEEYDFEPITPSSEDIIKPAPESMTTDVDTARLVDNPLYPLVHALGSMPGLNDRLVWLMLAWLAVIASMLFVHIGFDTKKGTEKPQHFVLTTIVGLGLSILFYTMGIFPLWVVILMVFGLIGSIIWERQPVL